MQIGIITAMPEETHAVLKYAPHPEKSRQQGLPIYRCSVAGHSLVLVEAGMGVRNAGHAVELLMLERRHDLIISAGLGGGVRPGLSVGEVVIADRVLLCMKGHFEEIPITTGSEKLHESFLRGTFVTTDGILNKKSLRELLPSDIPNPVVDMESAAIARVAYAHGISFMGIRAISDPWNEELGFKIDEFCDSGMRIRPTKVLATILRRPRIIPQLIRLSGTSRTAAAYLAKSMTLVLRLL